VSGEFCLLATGSTYTIDSIGRLRFLILQVTPSKKCSKFPVTEDVDDAFAEVPFELPFEDVVADKIGFDPLIESDTVPSCILLLFQNALWD
jgi:hypothetical protein